MTNPDPLSGGLAVECEGFFTETPEHPQMRESWSLWFYDDAGFFALPRIGIEREAWNWDTPRVQCGIAFADGRVMNGATIANAHSPFDEAGAPNVLGAGPIAWRTIEPFHRWRVSWDGPVRDGTLQMQIAKTMPEEPATPVSFEIELTAAAPAWAQVNAQADLDKLSEREAAEAAAMGIGWRLEQLVVGEGRLTVDGRTYSFSGRGTRVKRQSARPMAGFRGHCWQSATFPDGRGFAYIAYPPHEDGSQFNEAFVYKDGVMHAARVVEAPFLRRIVAAGDPAPLVLDSALGTTRIDAVTAFPTYRVGNPDLFGLNLNQGGALYTWDEQKAYGMVERSSHESLTTIG